MSVIIRLQNLPWSANALDIRNFFRGLSIPEGGVHIVGGEQGDAFIAFSTDEDARQAMMLDCGKIKEIQVRLLLSSRSEMHKVIEAARQTVPILTLTAPAPAPAPPIVSPAPVAQPVTLASTITPFSTALGNNSLLSSFGIPGIGNPNEIPQPAVIEAPTLDVNLFGENHTEMEKEDEKPDKRKDRRRTRSRSRSRDRDRKDRKRDRRDRSRSRERRRRDRSRSRERRDRKRDRKDRSRSRERSPSHRSRDRRVRKSPTSQEKNLPLLETPIAPPAPSFGPANANIPIQMNPLLQTNILAQNGPAVQDSARIPFNDPTINETLNKLQEIGKKRNPNAFQGDQNGGNQLPATRGGYQGSRGGTFRREGRPSRFDSDRQVRDCCVAIRNAPTHTSYGDVRRFFPFMIDKHGIKMINDNMGRRTGNIFVRFCESRSKQLALQRKTNELKGEEVSVDPLEDETYEAAVDSFLPFREDNEEEDANLIISVEDQNVKPYNVIKLTELPNFIKEHDIIKAFSDFSLLSIMLKDCRITRSKTAFVQFVNPEDAKKAYERREKLLFGRRHPTLTPISMEEYEEHKQQDEKTTEPVPPKVPEAAEEVPVPQVPRDPRQRRPQFEPVPQNVPQVQPQNAFFGTQFPPQQVFGPQFPGQQFGFSNPPIDPRTAAPVWQNQHSLNSIPIIPKQKPAINIEDEPLDCVLMKGFPREATDRTIVNFLSDTGAVPARIHLMLDQNGLPSGDCFCEFRSSQEARRAATKHGQNLDGCRVTVDLVPRSVVEEALEGPKQPEINDSVISNGPNFFEQNQRGGFGMRGSFRARGFDRGNFDRGGGFNRGGFDQARGNFRGRGNWNDRGGRGGFEGRGYDRGRGRGSFGRGRGFENGQSAQRTVDEDKEGLENFGAPGCVVSMENVPFRASIDDIMEFFSDFELTQDDVIRRYNERGQPTGDARVAFRSPFDAQLAVHSRHMSTIHDRRINVTLL